MITLMVSGEASAIVQRHLLPVTRELLRAFRVLVLSGPRQAGKTTLVRLLDQETGGSFFSLEDDGLRRAALDDPVGFVTGAATPQVIDEVHLGGDALVRAIKRHVDEDPRPGRFVLTGSANFLTVPTLSESLAGRAAFVDVWPFSRGEIVGFVERFIDRLFTDAESLRSVAHARLEAGDVFEIVCSGGFPEVQRMPLGRVRKQWFDSYVRTVTQRDIREVADVRRAAELPALLRILAARTGGELVLQHVIEDSRLSRSTVYDYVALLQTVYLVHTVPAWSRRPTSRVKRHAKVYVSDSGLAAHLLGKGPGALAAPGAVEAGPLLETFVVNELLKQSTWSEVDASLFHFRDRAGPEVDVILETRDGQVAGIEVKATSTIRGEHFRWLRLLEQRLGDAFVAGVVLYLGPHALPFGDRMIALPVSALWASD